MRTVAVPPLDWELDCEAEPEPFPLPLPSDWPSELCLAPPPDAGEAERFERGALDLLVGERGLD